MSAVRINQQGISMAASALNLKTMKTHPWEDLMEAFARIDLPVVVLKIDDGDAVLALLGGAADTVGGPTIKWV